MDVEKIITVVIWATLLVIFYEMWKKVGGTGTGVSPAELTALEQNQATDFLDHSQYLTQEMSSEDALDPANNLYGQSLGGY